MDRRGAMTRGKKISEVAVGIIYMGGNGGQPKESLARMARNR